MSYVPIGWINDSEPALNAQNLNRMDKGIADVDKEITNLKDGVEEIEERVSANETNIANKASKTDLTALDERVTTTETELQNKIDKGAIYSISANMLQPNSVSAEKIQSESITVDKLCDIDDTVQSSSQNLVRNFAVYRAIENAKSDLNKNVAQKADFESGTGSLTVSSSYKEIFPQANFKYTKIGNCVILNFEIEATASGHLQHILFEGLPFVAGTSMYKRVISTSNNDVYLTFSNTKSASSILLNAPDGFSGDTSIQDTIIYQMKE